MKHINIPTFFKALALLVFSSTAFSSVKVYIKDFLIPAGKNRTEMHAMAYQNRLYPAPLENIKVSFYIEGKMVGTAYTNSTGLASTSVSLQGLSQRYLSLRAVIRSKSRVITGHGLGLRAKEGSKVFITDIDETITTTPSKLALALPHWLIKMRSRANETLGLIARKRPLLYLTARPYHYKESTLAWLRKHNFPIAPVIFLNPSRFPLDRYRYKLQVLRQGRHIGLDYVAGAGDHDTDAKAYCAMGLKAFSFKAESRCATVVKNWPEVIKEL